MSVRRRYFYKTIFCILQSAFFISFAFNIPPALAQDVDAGRFSIIGAVKPGDTCPDEECRKRICPCLERAEDGSCAQGRQMQCFAGKCGLDAQDAAASSIPCNYTLDDIVATGARAAQFVFGIAGSLMLLMFVYGGYKILTSFGNSERVQAGRKVLTAAVIGGIIILGAALLIRGILQGLDIGVSGEPGVGKIEAEGRPGSGAQGPAAQNSAARGCTCTAAISGLMVTQGLCNQTAAQYHLNCSWSGGACNCSGPVPGVTQDQCSIDGIRQTYNIPDIPGVTVSGACSWQ